MRTNIEIDDKLMAEAQKAFGSATKRQTVEQALRLMIRLRRQQEVDSAFGKYRIAGAATWLEAAKAGGVGDRCRQQRLDRLPQWPYRAPCPGLARDARR